MVPRDEPDVIAPDGLGPLSQGPDLRWKPGTACEKGCLSQVSNNTPFSKLNPSLTLSDMSDKNPFAPVSPGEVPANAPEGSYTYALVQSAPSVPADECEVAAAAAEIVIRWGATTLHVAHLAPPRSFHVGEASGKDAVDFMLSAEKLGVARLPLLRKAADGSARVVIPAGATGTATIAGQVVQISDLVASRQAETSPAVAGAIEVPLRASTRVRFEIGGIELEIASVNAGRKLSGRFSFDRRGLPFQAMSLALHLGLLGAAAVLMPPLALASEDAMSPERIDNLRSILAANAEAELAASQDHVRDDVKASRDSSPGRPAAGATGHKGSAPGRGAKGKSGAFEPWRYSSSVSPSRADMLAMARSFGMNELLQAGAAGSPSAAAWGDVATRAGDPKRASLWDGSTETGGGGRLDLTGVGDNGDSDGRGIALDRIGTRGLTGGTDRFGMRTGFERSPRRSGISMRPSDTTTSGRLPAEVIQRVVRQNFGRFRLCYENGLRNNPSLAGRVSVRFVIARDGSVMSAANGGADLTDPAVVSCVVQSFRGLQFPQIEDGGAATVVYPITFAPAK
jgi:hypothetical protein